MSTFERLPVCRRSRWVEPNDRAIDRSTVQLAGRNARKKVASRKKDAIPKTGNWLAADLRGGRAVRESDAKLLPADERSRPDSEVFFFIFGEVIGKKSSLANKHAKHATIHVASNRLHVLYASLCRFLCHVTRFVEFASVSD